jgi:predicted Zn-ribbon and HTH transcriptional regulator
MSHADVERRKKMSMPPGAVTVFLHPVLITDTNLLNHTYVHELLHATGLTAHDPLHDELVQALAPMPKLSESPLLQRLRGAVLAEQEITAWDCENCGFSWSRTTVRPPLRCPKCARKFR